MMTTSCSAHGKKILKGSKSENFVYGYGWGTGGPDCIPWQFQSIATTEPQPPKRKEAMPTFRKSRKSYVSFFPLLSLKITGKGHFFWQLKQIHGRHTYLHNRCALKRMSLLIFLNTNVQNRIPYEIINTVPGRYVRKCHIYSAVPGLRSLRVSKKNNKLFLHTKMQLKREHACILKILFNFSLHTKEHDCRISPLLAVLPQPRPCAWHGLKQPAGKAAHVVALVFFFKKICFSFFCMKTLRVRTWPPQPPCFSKAFADFTNFFWNSGGTSQKIWDVDKLYCLIAANSKIWERSCFSTYPIQIFPAAALSRRYKNRVSLEQK